MTTGLLITHRLRIDGKILLPPANDSLLPNLLLPGLNSPNIAPGVLNRGYSTPSVRQSHEGRRNMLDASTNRARGGGM
eukprot:1186391-Prorocentrum_minimum.AAC.2